MEKKIVGYIPNLLFKFYLHLKDRFDPKPPISYEEKTSVDICLNLISRKDSKLTYAPKSHKRFIKNDMNDMFIVVENRTVNLNNHVYSYTVYIEDVELYNTLIDSFDIELEKRREDLENEIKNNIQHSLNNILNKLN